MPRRLGSRATSRSGRAAQDERAGCRRALAASGGHTMTDLLGREPRVIAAGVGLLADALARQGGQLTRVDWSPPMPGTEADLAAVLADPRRTPANALAVQRMLAVRAQLVDVVGATTALGLSPGEFLHAGPPVTWERASGPMRGALMGAAVFEGLTSEPDAAED